MSLTENGGLDKVIYATAHFSATANIKREKGLKMAKEGKMCKKV